MRQFPFSQSILSRQIILKETKIRVLTVFKLSDWKKPIFLDFKKIIEAFKFYAGNFTRVEINISVKCRFAPIDILRAEPYSFKLLCNFIIWLSKL